MRTNRAQPRRRRTLLQSISVGMLLRPSLLLNGFDGSFQLPHGIHVRCRYLRGESQSRIMLHTMADYETTTTTTTTTTTKEAYNVRSPTLQRTNVPAAICETASLMIGLAATQSGHQLTPVAGSASPVK
jgi:hypothetical protein